MAVHGKVFTNLHEETIPFVTEYLAWYEIETCSEHVSGQRSLMFHCLKSVFCGRYFPVIGLDMVVYTVNLRIQSKWISINPFLALGSTLYPLKTSLMFPGVTERDK